MQYDLRSHWIRYSFSFSLILSAAVCFAQISDGDYERMVFTAEQLSHGIIVSDIFDDTQGDTFDIRVFRGDDEMISWMKKASRTDTLPLDACDVVPGNIHVGVFGTEGYTIKKIIADVSSEALKPRTLLEVDPALEHLMAKPRDHYPEVQMSCFETYDVASFVHLEDSTKNYGCTGDYQRIVFRKWLHEPSSRVLMEKIQIVRLDHFDTSMILLPDQKPVFPILNNETKRVISSYESCRWQNSSELDCRPSGAYTDIDIQVDNWPVSYAVTPLALRLPDPNQTDATIDIPWSNNSVLKTCEADVVYLNSSGYDLQKNSFEVKHQLISSKGNDASMMELTQEASMIDDVAPRLYFMPEGYTYEVKNSNQDFLDVSIPSPLLSIDNCSGIDRITVTDGRETWNMTYDAVNDAWRTTAKTRIESGKHKDLHYHVYDKAGNDAFYKTPIYVKKYSSTVSSSGVRNITISGEKQWIDVDKLVSSTSYGWKKHKVFARRLDWEDFCIDLCPRNALHSEYDIERLDALSVLGDGLGDKKVEEHYEKQIKWFLHDGDKCERKIAESWKKAIKEYWTESCGIEGQHGYGHVHIDPKDPLGGGWCKDVPFSCDDVCKEVMVEVLYMDGYCNWHLDWITVRVKSASSSNSRIKKLSDVTISCEAYEDYYSEALQNAMDFGASDRGLESEEAFAELDDLFGTYKKAHQTNHYGWPVDEYGHEHSSHFSYKTKTCQYRYQIIKRYDYDHYGNKIWVRDTIWEVDIASIDRHGHLGFVKATCATKCVQDIWDYRDNCGLGKIIRRFKFINECGGHHYSSNRTYEQVINIVPGCNAFHKHSLEIPADTVVCQELSFSPDKNVDLGEDFPQPDVMIPTGCNKVGISMDDQVFKLVGYDNVYKVRRDYTLKDWCTGKGKSFTQKIIVDETCTEYDKSTVKPIDVLNTSSLNGLEISAESSAVDNTSVADEILRSDSETEKVRESNLVVIRNALGQVVYRYMTLELKFRPSDVDALNLPSGTYFAQWLERDNKEITRFVLTD